MLPSNKAMDEYLCFLGNNVSLAKTHSTDRYCHKGHVYQTSSKYLFKFLLGSHLKSLQGQNTVKNVSLMLRRITTYLMTSTFSVGKIFNFNCHS